MGLDWLAALLSAECDVFSAALVFGAGDAHWSECGVARYPPDQLEYQVDVARLRAQLDDTAFSDAWENGRTMNSEEVIVNFVNDLLHSTNPSDISVCGDVR